MAQVRVRWRFRQPGSPGFPSENDVQSDRDVASSGQPKLPDSLGSSGVPRLFPLAPAPPLASTARWCHRDRCPAPPERGRWRCHRRRFVGIGPPRRRCPPACFCSLTSSRSAPMSPPPAARRYGRAAPTLSPACSRSLASARSAPGSPPPDSRPGRSLAPAVSSARTCSPVARTGERTVRLPAPNDHERHLCDILCPRPSGRTVKPLPDRRDQPCSKIASTRCSSTRHSRSRNAPSCCSSSCRDVSSNHVRFRCKTRLT